MWLQFYVKCSRRRNAPELIRSMVVVAFGRGQNGKSMELCHLQLMSFVNLALCFPSDSL